MEVSSQDPPLMAMDLSKGFAVNTLTRSHTEAMDLAKKPEWYHRRLPSCSSELGSTFRPRASSSYSSMSAPLHPEPAAPAHRRDMEPCPDSLGNYMNPPLELYRDGVHGGLWHPGFYGPEQRGGAIPESSGGEESDSGSDVIFLVSTAKEPLLCSPFIQDSVRHIVEPLSPAVSLLDEGRGCYHLPQPLSSPSPDSSYSEDSSDSSVDIPVHHARPVVLLSDLSAVYRTAAESPVDVSSDDSDIIEVSVTREKKKSDESPCKKRVQSSPQSEEEKTPRRGTRFSSRLRKSVSDTREVSSSPARHSLRRRAKNNMVGIYNESCDWDDVLEYAVRLSSSEADESPPQASPARRSSSNSEQSSDRNSPQRGTPEPRPRRDAARTQSVSQKRKKPVAVHQTKKLRSTERKQSSRSPAQEKSPSKVASTKPVARRRRKRRPQAGPSAPFHPREPEIKLRFAAVKEEKKEKKSSSFCPFVHMERRTCTVVNYQEDEASVRSSRGALPPATGRKSSGFVPNTSCFQLGRFSAETRAQGALQCCLCGHSANDMGLGDLHGPYQPVSPAPDCLNQSLDHSQSLDQSQDQSLAQSLDQSQSQDQSLDQDQDHSQDQSLDQSQSQDGRTEQEAEPVDPGGCDGGGSCAVNQQQQEKELRLLPQAPPRLSECWIHEDCGIWSAGVFLVRGKLYGLEEAARLAQETVCSVCQQTGAIMGCFQKGCPRNYHYRCAIQSGCVLNEDNFSIRCPEHKNKLLTCVTRQHKR